MAEAMVVLVNVDTMPFQAVLYHDIVCARRQVCTCKTTYVGAKSKPIREEASFRLNPKEESDPLPAAVKLIPQVRTAMARGTLKVQKAQKVHAEVEKIRRRRVR